MSKRKLLCAALALSLSLGGCAGNYREIENMAIITGAALDIGKRETYSLTYELVEFGGVDPDSAGKPQYITVEGDTLAECAQNFGLITGKFGFWGHAVILLISEPLAREGLTEPLDWFLKQSQTRLNLYIAVTSGSARALLEAPPVGTQLSAGQLADMLSPQVGSSEKHHFKLFEVFNTLRTGGTALSLPWFTLQNPLTSRPLRLCRRAATR